MNCLLALCLFASVVFGNSGAEASAPINPACEETTSQHPCGVAGCTGRHEICGFGNGILGCDDDRCETYQRKYVNYPQICLLFVKQMCVCREGYARSNGVCIPLENCPCKCNEIPSTNGNLCGQTCKTFGGPCTYQWVKPKPGQCSCKPGYVRCTTVSYDCVPSAFCAAVKPKPE